jgi:monofunctional biosynthetic peptidoglycan transglycosylase
MVDPFVPQPSNIAAPRKRRIPLRRAALAIAIVALLLVIAVAADIGLTWVRFRPRVAAMALAAPELTAYMERRSDEGHPPRLRQWASLASLPTVLACAVVATEDNKFFLYGTVDWNSQRYAARRLLRGDASRGGSGITQQLARNLFLGPERTPRRKLREFLLAYQISHTLSKERQLELYLNIVEWGDGVWGVVAASRQLFGRPPAELKPTEIVLLVNLLPAPSRGLRFPLSPRRRGKLEVTTTALWREGLFDDLTRTATAARLKRMGELIDLGMTPTAALETVRAEMGPEPLVIADDVAASSPLRVLCDRKRRGVSE